MATPAAPTLRPHPAEHRGRADAEPARVGGVGGVRRLVAVLTAASLGALATATHAQTPRFDLIQPRQGFFAIGFQDAAFDGTVIGNDLNPDAGRTFVWVPGQGREEQSAYYGRISGNGRYMANAQGRRIDRQTGTLITMPTLGLPTLVIGGINQDGNVIVGDNVDADDNRIAFRWKPETGTIPIPSEFGSFNRYTYAVSGDGRTVGGIQDGFGNLAGGWVWNESAGFTYPVGPRGDRGLITAINSDGRIWAGGGDVLGGNGTDIVNGVMRWVDGVGHEIPMLGTYTYGEATGISDDGKIVLGQLHNGPGPGPRYYGFTVWEEGLGSFYIEDYLRMKGVAIPENNYISHPVISGDGLTFAGTIVSYGTGLPNGYGIVVTLPTPGGIGVLALAPIATRRRRVTRSPVPCR